MRDTVRSSFREDIRRAAARRVANIQETDKAVATLSLDEAIELEVELRARHMLAVAAVTVLVACWWITVAMPIPVTSLLPILLLPVLGVMPIRDAAAPYADPNIFLFMGGFIIALALERWGLHRRFALGIVVAVGTRRRTLILGFMIATAFLSMWISNTATTMMMLPIALAVIVTLNEGEGGDTEKGANFAAGMMLAVAYAANIGGIATPIGTPPNIVFRGQYEAMFPNAPEISFGGWVLLWLPFAAIFLPIAWFVLTRITCPVGKDDVGGGREVVRQELAKLGPMARPERLVLVVFATTAALWMTRSIPIAGGNYGWAALIEKLLSGSGKTVTLFRASYVGDATVAIATAVVLFIIPAKRDHHDRVVRLMDWKTAQRLPWGILLLFGGGFSIAAAFGQSGLSGWCGMILASLGVSNVLVMVGLTCLLVKFLTEITSNTATAQVILPIVGELSVAMGMNPLTLMLPATISASCAFMLPVATPPNAIVFGSGYIGMRRMVRSGLILNLIAVVLVTAFVMWIVRPMETMGVAPIGP